MSMKNMKKSKEWSLDVYFYIKDLIWTDMSNIADVKFGFELKNKPDGDSKVQPHTALIAVESLPEKRDWLKDIKGLVKDHQVAEVKRMKTALGIAPTENKPSPIDNHIATKQTRSPSVSSLNLPNSYGTNKAANRGSAALKATPRKVASKGDLLSHGRSTHPEPPPDDHRLDWRMLQDEIDNTPIEPMNFISPPRWGIWCEYQSDDFGIPFYYNIQTRATTWSKPTGWDTSNNNYNSMQFPKK